jgi:hypothetical protein
VLASQRGAGVSVPCSPDINLMEWLWRDLKDKPAYINFSTIIEWSDALCAIIQQYAYATLQSLTSFAYFIHAVEAAQ